MTTLNRDLMSDGDNEATAFQRRVTEARTALEAGNGAVLDYLVPGWREVALSTEAAKRPTPSSGCEGSAGREETPGSTSD